MFERLIFGFVGNRKADNYQQLYCTGTIKLNILNSCPTQGWVEGWDAMKPQYYRSVSSKGAGRPRLMHHHKGGWNETKWMRWVWRNGGKKICGRGKREKPREKSTQTPFRPPRNPHGGTETRTRDPSGGRRAANRLRHKAAYRSNAIENMSYIAI